MDSQIWFGVGRVSQIVGGKSDPGQSDRRGVKHSENYSDPCLFV